MLMVVYTSLVKGVNEVLALRLLLGVLSPQTL